MRKLLGLGVPCLLLLLLGAAGVAAMVRREQAESAAPLTHGPFWSLESDAGGAVDDSEAPVDTADGGLLLDGRHTLRFIEEDTDVLHFKTIGLAAQAVAPHTVVEISLRQVRDARLVVSLLPGDPFVARIMERGVGEERVLAQGSAKGLMPDGLAPFSASVSLQGPQLTLTVKGKRLATCRATGSWRGKVTLAAGEGAFRVQRITATGKRTTQHGDWRPFSESQGLVPSPPPPAGAVLIGLGVVAGAWLFAALWLAVLCLGRAGPAAAAWSASLLLAPACAPLAFAIRRTPAHLEAFVTAGLLVGLVFAIASLRPALAAAGSGAGAGAAAAPGGWRRRAGVALAALMALALVGATALVCGRQMHTARSAVAVREEAARQLPLPAPWVSHGRVTLDGSNARRVPGTFHNVSVGARVRLPPGAALGVRLRAPDGEFAHGQLLVLSTDPRLASGFWHEDQVGFDEPDEPSPPLPADTDVRLEVTARGRALSATLDGRPWATQEDLDFESGGVVVLALRGAAQVDGLQVRGLPGDEPAAPIAGHVAGAAAALPLAAALFALLAAALLRRPWLPTLAACALALSPVLLVLAFPRHAGHVNDDELRRMGVAAAAMLAVFALLPGPGALRPAARALVLLPAAGLLVTGALGLTIDRTMRVDDSNLNRMSYLDWKGERLDGDLLYLRHPILRRWNEYLARHLFRGRQFPLAKPAGTVRVVSLGGSSTWGFRIPSTSRGDYPSQLERRLTAARAGGALLPPVEVINGAFVGATGARLYPYLRDALLAFSPDIVTLSLTFNDSTSCSLGDEEAYYERITAPGASRSWWTERRVDRELLREREALAAIKLRLDADGRRSAELWRACGLGSSPPERFAATLRRFAELGRQRGFRLVLIKEPWVGPGRLVWREEFHDAIDRVAAEYGLPVVDPAPDIAAAGGASLFMDGVHATAEGNTVIAAALERVVRGLLEPPAAVRR